MNNIHPTAQIDSSVKLGKNIKIAANVIVENDVQIDDDCVFGVGVVIKAHTQLGKENYIGEYSVLGGDPNIFNFDLSIESKLIIGNNNTIKEHCVIHRGSKKGINTQIGNNNYFMVFSHIGHDCVLGDYIITGPGVAIGGHVQVQNNANISSGTRVHQFARIGSYAFIAPMALLRQDAIPYLIIKGDSAKHIKVNINLLKKENFIQEEISAIQNIFRQLRKNTKIEQIEQSINFNSQRVSYLVEWLKKDSPRGIAGFIRSSRKN